MIKHIVMWKLKCENQQQHALEMKKRLESLQGIIKEVVKIEVGINQIVNDQAYDVVLFSEFLTKEDLNKYQVNPDHQKVVAYIKEVTEKRVFVDYEV